MQNDTLPDDLAIPGVFRHSAFFDLLADAAFQHRHATQVSDSFTMTRFARASVLASALSVECVANCLLASLELPKALLSDLDKLTPIAKIETYLRLRSVAGFDRGRAEVQRVVELVKARNDHVHPKTFTIPAKVNKPQDGGDDWIVPFNMDGEHWEQLRIPKRSLFWSDASSLAALGAVASFYNYLFTQLLNISGNELQCMLGSRLEIQDAHIVAVFDDVSTELRNMANEGVDLAFFGLFQAPASA